MFKNFLMKKALQAKLSGLPEEERVKIEKAVEENPAFFEEMVRDLQAELSGGKNQMDAFMSVAKKHEATLKNILSK